MTLPTLWVRFSDESISVEAIDEDALQKLEILLKEVLCGMGFLAPSGLQFFSRVNQTPYLNFSLLTSVLSNGCLHIIRKSDGGFQVQSAKSRIASVIALIKLHWKLEQQLSSGVENIKSLQARSLALGICQQILFMRLPRHTPDMFAAWLIKPQQAPLSARRTLRQILTIQKRRDMLSDTWNGFFQSQAVTSARATVSPELIWSDQASYEMHNPSVPKKTNQLSWKGLAVFPGSIEGRFWLVSDSRKHNITPPDGTSIFIFLHARPHAVEFYPQAVAILFIEGGILSHACCVAREQHIPCITGLGKEFLSAIQSAPLKYLRIEVHPSNGIGTATIL